MSRCRERSTKTRANRGREIRLLKYRRKIRRKDQVETSGNGHDPWQYLQLVAAGFLGAFGKRIWEVMRGEKRPEGEQHSDSYLAEEVRLIRESQDRTEAQVESLVKRIARLEQRKRSATSGD